MNVLELIKDHKPEFTSELGLFMLAYRNHFEKQVEDKQLVRQIFDTMLNDLLNKEPFDKQNFKKALKQRQVLIEGSTEEIDTSIFDKPEVL